MYLVIRYIFAQICCLEGCTMYRNIAFLSVIPLKYSLLCLQQFLRNYSINMPVLLKLYREFRVIHQQGNGFTSKVITLYFGAFYFPLVDYYTVTILGAKTIPLKFYLLYPLGSAMFTIGLGACLMFLADVDTQSKRILRKWKYLQCRAQHSISMKAIRWDLKAECPVSFRSELGTSLKRATKTSYFYHIIDTSVSVMLATRVKF